MAHDHTNSHTPDRSTERRALKAALTLIVAFMVVGGRGRRDRQVARAAVRRRAHADRRRRADDRARRRSARGPPGERHDDLRPRPSRDPERAGQRRHAAGPVGADRDRRDLAPDLAPARAWRPGADRRDRRDRGQPARGADPGAGLGRTIAASTSRGPTVTSSPTCTASSRRPWRRS